MTEERDVIAALAAEILDGSPASAWKALGQAGLLTLAVPEELGGAGLGAAETAVVLTEIGRRAADLPALSTLALGVLTVARWGTAEQRRELLSGVGEGRVLTAALGEPGDPMTVLPGATATAIRAEPTTGATAGAGAAGVAAGRLGAWVVTGTKTGIPDAERADRILVPVRTDGGGVAVALVEPGAAGVTRQGSTLRLDAAPGEPLGTDTTGACLADLHRFAVLGACALGDGAVAGALDLTARHVRGREQFGRPLATFQAVAQQIADVCITARTLHLAVTAAAGLGDDDLAVAAQWFTAEAPPAVRTCHHLHGGLGLTIDYPLHRHGTLVRDLVRLLGGGELCLQRLGGRLAD